MIQQMNSEEQEYLARWPIDSEMDPSTYKSRGLEDISKHLRKTLEKEKQTDKEAKKG